MTARVRRHDTHTRWLRPLVHDAWRRGRRHPPAGQARHAARAVALFRVCPLEAPRLLRRLAFFDAPAARCSAQAAFDASLTVPSSKCWPPLAAAPRRASLPLALIIFVALSWCFRRTVFLAAAPFAGAS